MIQNSIQNIIVKSQLDSLVEIGENPIQFLMGSETESCKLSPQVEDNFEIFECNQGFNMNSVTLATTQGDTLPSLIGFLKKDEAEIE